MPLAARFNSVLFLLTSRKNWMHPGLI